MQNAGAWDINAYGSNPGAWAGSYGATRALNAVAGRGL